jgi:GT2 family glycosyltransferase
MGEDASSDEASARHRRPEGTPVNPAADGLVSVITVNFNAGAHLLACARAALASTVPIELLVVDNASDDRSLDTLREGIGFDRRMRILENGVNIGFAGANNQGLAEARGGWLLFLNPDCLVEPGTVGEVRSVLEAHPEAGMAGCLLLNPDGTEQAGCRRETPTPGKAFVRAFGLGRVARRLRLRGVPVRDFVRTGDPLPSQPVEVDAISGAFMFVRRAALERVGPLDEGYFLHCEDLDWCLRFRQAGFAVLFVPGVSVVHQKGVSSRGRPLRVLWHMHRGMVRYYRKFYRDRYARPFFWVVLAGVWLRFGALAGLALLKRGHRAGR